MLTREKPHRPEMKVEDGSLTSQEPGVPKAEKPGRVGTVTTKDAKPRAAAGRTKGAGTVSSPCKCLRAEDAPQKRPAGANKPDTNHLLYFWL